MADVLSNIPGLAGYLAMQDRQRQQAMGDLQGVSGLMNTLRQQQEAQRQAEMAPLQRQLVEAQVQAAQAQGLQRTAQANELERKSRARQAFMDALPRMYPNTPGIEAPSEALGGGPGRPEIPNPMQGLMGALVDLDPSGISDVVKLQMGGGRSAGAEPMLVKIKRSAAEARAAGNIELADQLDAHAQKLAHGEKWNAYQQLLSIGIPHHEALNQAFGANRTVAPGGSVIPMLSGQPAPPNPGQPAPQPAPQPALQQGGLPNVTPEQQARRDDGRMRILMAERADALNRGDTQAVAELNKEIRMVSGSGAAPSQGVQRRPDGSVTTQPRLKTLTQFHPTRGENVEVLFDEMSGKKWFQGQDVTDITRPPVNSVDQKAERDRQTEIKTLKMVNGVLDSIENVLDENPRTTTGLLSLPSNVGYAIWNGIVGNATGFYELSPTARAGQAKDLVLTTMHNLGKTSDKDMKILNRVWGMDVFGNPEKLRIAVKTTREIAKANFAGAETGVSRTRPGVQGGSGQVPQITSDEEFNRLPSGTVFIDPNGKLRTKP